MTMLGTLYRRVLIPGFETIWHRRSTLRRLKKMEQSQWLSLEEHRTRQLVALRELAAYTEAHCPYYREAWRELGLSAAELKTLEDFRRWPILERETITANRFDMRAQVPGLKLIKKATGGSSGVPLQFDLDWASNDAKMAAWHRGYAWAGARLGTKQFYLWGGAIAKQSLRQRWKEAIFHWLYRRKIVSSFRMSDEHVGWYLGQLNRHRPDAIVAYVNPLYQFARLLEERGERPFSPGTIVVGAEKLHDFQREVIERVFRSRVFETYGSREFTLIGAECEKRAGLHVTMENLLVEVVDDDGEPTTEGEVGNVVVTDLTNFGMPFFRYRIGDQAIAGWGECSCGRGLPLLCSVKGRQLDVIETADGRLIPGEFFPHLLKDFSAVRRFQVVQGTRTEVTLTIVARNDWTPSDKHRISTEATAVLGPAVNFRIELVNDIPLTAAGKQRVVVALPRQQRKDELAEVGT
jgi:phenylacetate-CoA ligase